jgi:hypothetical protein
MQIDPIGPASAPASARNQRVGSAEFSLPGDIPDAPPLDVRRAVDASTGATDALRAQGRELHFEVDDATGQVRVELRDLDGRVLRSLAPRGALDLLAGGE